MSSVYTLSHNIARTDTNGIEARIAPTNELRLAISEIRTISSAVIVIFNM